MIIGALIGGAITLYASSQDRKDSKKRLGKGDAALQFQQEIYDEQLAQYQKYYEPVVEGISQELQQGADLEAEANWSRDEFTRNYDASLDESRRQQRRYGVDPTSTQAARFEEDVAYDRAAGSALAANRARQDEDDRHFARQLSFIGGGLGLQNSAAAGYGQIAQTQYGIGEQFAAGASAGAGALGQYVSDIYQGAKDYRTRPADTTRIERTTQTPLQSRSSRDNNPGQPKRALNRGVDKLPDSGQRANYGLYRRRN